MFHGGDQSAFAAGLVPGVPRRSVPPLVMSVWAGSVSAVTIYLTHVGVRDRASQRQMTGPYLKDATEVRPKETFFLLSMCIRRCVLPAPESGLLLYDMPAEVPWTTFCSRNLRQPSTNRN